MNNFKKDFRENGLNHIEAAAKKVNPEVDCFEFSILAGMAQGKPNLELESVMEFAEYKQKPIARFQCEMTG